ncbi:MAG TPA: sigma-70 family RNA polymerase sigma factor [Actinomycetota bacterium]|nr:sigma-70 family RNA polymerase sigma factor [Actinomycetota bacterium]
MTSQSVASTTLSPAHTGWAASASPAELLASADGGDQAAWHQLVERYGRVVWAVARSHGLSTADAADVSQMTWLRLFQSPGSVRDPNRLSGWLGTTARREALRVIARRQRELTSWDDAYADRPDPNLQDPDGTIIVAERDEALLAAFARLPAKHQQLLRLLLGEAELSYAQIGQALGMPVGSIGPTRQRCLEHLRAMLDGVDLFDGFGRHHAA